MIRAVISSEFSRRLTWTLVLPRAGVVALALCAFALQTWGLETQSFWYDEGFSAWLAARPSTEIVARTAADIHPPLYYQLLHGWIILAGQSEYSFRFPSVLAAVVTVPLLWQLARRLLSTRAADVAAVLVAFSPLWLWYAREARMYTLLTALGVASFLILLSLLERGPRLSLLLGLAALDTAAVYTHFYAWFLVAVQGGWIVLWYWRAPRKIIPFLAPLALTFLAYLPWLGFVLNRLDADRSYWSGALDVRYVLSTLLESWATGHGMRPEIAFPLGLVFAGLVLAGLGVLVIGGRGRVALALALTLVVPLLGLFAISFGRPKYHPRYLMFAAPGALLAVAALVSWLSARREWAGRAPGRLVLLGVLLIFATADAATLSTPPSPKDDWRGVAQAIQADNRGEPVLLLSGHAFPVFTYYDHDTRWIPLPDAPTLDTEQVVSYRDVAGLRSALEGAAGLWVVRWQDEVVDPDDVLAHALRSGGATRDHRQQYQGIVLEHWRLPAALTLPATPRPEIVVDQNFSDSVTLLGVTGPAAPPPADAGLTLTFFWEARRVLEEDLKVRLAVEDADGFVWGEADRRPANYLHPTFRWRPGDPRPAEVTIPLQAGTPPGAYFVRVTVYREGDPSGLDLLDHAGAPAGKELRLGPFAVAPAEGAWTERAEAALPATATRLGATTGTPIEALGVQVEAPVPLEPGRRVPVRLWWRATGPTDRDLMLALEWRQNGGLLPATEQMAPGGDEWPTSRWRTGELVLTQAAPRVPAEASEGPIELIARFDPEGAPLVLASLTVTPGSRDFTPPDPEHRQTATFGDRIGLVGYNFGAVERGRPLEITLFWQALAPSEQPLKAFVHLLDSEGRFAAGQDALPERPTDGWVAEEYVVQTFHLPLEALASGSYQVEIGWYDSADPGSRLPVQGDGADGANRRVLLDTIVEVP